MNADMIILAPVITEKSNLQSEQGRYVFKVAPHANKIQIMQAVRTMFNVHPSSCNIINVKRKPRRVRYRKGYTASWKKAIVALVPNEKIPLFEGS